MSRRPLNLKRKFNEKYPNVKRMCKPPEHPVIDWINSQRGIRQQVVLFYSSLDSPYTIIHNAIDRINCMLNVSPVNVGDNLKPNCLYQLKINEEVICEGVYCSEGVAKRELADVAFHNLQRTCFSIFRKIHPRDSPIVDIVPTRATSSTTEVNTEKSIKPSIPSTSMGGLGAQMMKKMGWSGGGLGSNCQGRMDIVLPYIQIERQGLGSDNIIREVRDRLEMYARSRDINSIAFSCDFTKEERASIHQVARKLQLKSKSYGKDEGRTLIVQSKISPWDLVHTLLTIGGENEQFKLIFPTNYVQ